MSANNKDIPGYSTSDIERYRKGELSAREMHELESAALEDPFLADALEGMEIHRALREGNTTGQATEQPVMPTFDEDMALLETRLENRVAQTDRKVRIFIPRLRAAAAIILLLGLGTAAYYILQRRSGTAEPMAARTSAHSTDTRPAAIPPADTARTAIVADSSAISNAYAARPVTLKRSHYKDKAIARLQPASPLLAKTEAKQALPDSPPNSISMLRAVEIAPEPRKVISIRGIPPNVQKDTVSYEPAFLAKKASPVSRFGALPDDHHAFTGKVLGENNQPLAGASVFLKGHADISTVTDQQGLFSFDLHEKDSAAKLTVAYIGYQSASLDLNYLKPNSPYLSNNNLNNNDLAGNIIQLQPQHNSLGEVVVTGYGQKRKETLSDVSMDIEEKTDTLWLKAVPVTGRQAYLDYLATEKKKLALDSTIKGTEIISFNVSKKGELSAFKVEQSLSPAHDSSTIRLVQKGPSWKLLRGRQVRTSIQVRY
jgi:hypothetical protein